MASNDEHLLSRSLCDQKSRGVSGGCLWLKVQQEAAVQTTARLQPHLKAGLGEQPLPRSLTWLLAGPGSSEAVGPLWGGSPILADGSSEATLSCLPCGSPHRQFITWQLASLAASKHERPIAFAIFYSLDAGRRERST